MSQQRDFTVLTDCTQITCIVEKGQGDTLVKAAREAGAQGATVYYARGSGVRERLGLLGVAVEVEKEIINIRSYRSLLVFLYFLHLPYLFCQAG